MYSGLVQAVRNLLAKGYGRFLKKAPQKLCYWGSSYAARSGHIKVMLNLFDSDVRLNLSSKSVVFQAFTKFHQCL